MKLLRIIKDRLRVLYFYDEGRIVICTHGFVKKSQKTRQSEIKHALQIMRKYFEDKKWGEIQIYEEAGD